jgi:hypothetical protein
MIRNHGYEICARGALACVWIVMPLGCARGVEGPSDLASGGGSDGTSGAAGTAGTASSGDMGGAPAATTTGGAGTAGPIGGGGGGEGGSGNVREGGAEAAAGAGGGGAAGVGGGGAAGVGVGGAAGAGGGGAAGSAGGAAGATSGGGAAGNAGSPGTGGIQGGGGNIIDSGAADQRATDGSNGAEREPPRPTGITLGQPAGPSAVQSGSSPFGTAFSQTCMPNEVVIGYTGTVDAPGSALTQLRTFRAVCGSLSVLGTTTFSVATSTAETLTMVGTMPGPTQLAQMCASNEMVIGFGGRSAADIDQIAIRCTPLTISGASPNYSLTIGTVSTNPGLGGPGGNPFAAIDCPAGQVAVGDDGRAATTINAFGLLCATPALVVQ